MKPGRSILVFFLVGVLFFYLFLLWQFPYERLKKSWIQGFQAALPLTLSIDRLAPSFPLDLRAEGIGVRGGGFSFQVPDLTLHPNLTGLLLGKTDFDLRGADIPSRLQGSLRQAQNQNRLSLQLNKLEIHVSWGKESSVRVQLSGEASFQWEGEDWEKGNGQAWALLERGEIRASPASAIPLPLTLFDTLRGEIQVRDGMAKIRRLEVSGKDTRFNLPQDFQIPLRGGVLPPELALLFPRS